MKPLFKHCIEVLDEACVPIHYRKLTSVALARLRGFEASSSELKDAENVREKLLEARSRGTAYAGNPHCLGMLRRWFKQPRQPDLLNPDRIVIPGSAAAGFSAVFESLKRSPFMMTKTIDSDARWRALGKGMVIEKTMGRWFQQRWPTLFLPPDNDGKWREPCSHDFKLKVPGRDPVLVDVWGQAANGEYRAPPGKKPVHLHLQCRGDDQSDDVIWEGVATETLFGAGLLPVEALSPIRMVVYLNCLRDGVDYRAMQEAAA